MEALQLTTQGKNCMSGGHFRPGSVIHILVRNKLIVHVDFLEEDEKKFIIVKCVPHVPNAFFFHHSSWILKLPNREFKQPQRLRQIKHHFKINICRIATIL